MSQSRSADRRHGRVSFTPYVRTTTVKLFSIAGVIAALLAASAAGQDAVEIKIGYPKAGDRAKVTIEEKNETKLSLKIQGKEQGKDEVKTKSLVYVDEVIENPAGGKQPTKVKRSYEKAVTGNAGVDTTLGIEGKTVLIEKKGEKFAFSVDGKAVDAESRKLLDAEFNKADKDDSREMMFPKKAVKPGDTWTIDAEKLSKSLNDKDFKVDAAKLVANGKLVKAYTKDGNQFGVIEVNVTVPITDLGPKSPIKLKEGKLTVAISGDAVIDGTSPQGKSVSVMTFAVAGSGERLEMKMEAKVTETRTLVPLQRK